MREKKTTEQFIKEATLIHEDSLDFSLSVYNKANEKIIVICKKHGEFRKIPNEILRGRGCPKCRKRKPIDRPIKKVYRSHDDNDKRQCSKCKLFFEKDFFYPNKATKDGLSSACKKCAMEATRKAERKDPILTKSKRTEYSKRKWREHLDNTKEEREIRNREKKILSEQCRLLDNIKRKLKVRLKKYFKEGEERTHVKDLLGCSLLEFKQHLESLWSDGMSWDNYGYNGWHIDHIIPCAYFDLTNVEEQKKCFHYTNLRPLWKEDNQRKGSIYNGVNYRRTIKGVNKK